MGPRGRAVSWYPCGFLLALCSDRRRGARTQPYCSAWNRRVFLFSVLTLVLLLSVPTLVFPFSATVKTVFDGDSIILTNGTKARYFGVNIPECKQPFAEEAKQLSTQLVRGKEVEVLQAKKKHDSYDGYGRLLAYVFVNDSLINTRLLEEGLGYLFTFGPFAHYEEWLTL